MTTADADRQDDDFTEWLAEADDALASGDATPFLKLAAAPAEVRQRLEKNLACARLVREALRLPGIPSHLPLSPEGDRGKGEGTALCLPWTHLGRFRLLRELGRGGCGVVYLAHDPLLNRPVALKVPRAEVVASPEARERFQREARAASCLDHPNLVPVHEAGEDGPVCFLVFAYCPGDTLAEWLRRQKDPVPIADAARLLVTLADAVAHAHQRGVLHRDLKPSNILLTGEGPEARSVEPATSALDLRPSPLATPKITDFGLAKLTGNPPEGTGDEVPTHTGAILGTPGYMAPEQAAGKSRDVGPAADVYSLGAILYELITGRPPFRGETVLDTLLQARDEEAVPPSRLRARLPRDLDTICLKCLHKDPAKRYRSAAALAEDLRRYLGGKAILARPAGKIEKCRRWCQRNPFLAAVSGLAAAALLAVAVGSVFVAVQENRHARDLGDALKTAEENRRKVESQRAENCLDRGLILCEQGEVGRGMLWLSRGLEWAPDDAVDLRRVLRANLSAWSGRLGWRPRAAVEHGGKVWDMAFSPDGGVFATGGRDGMVRFWDTATGKPVGVPLVHPQSVECLAFDGTGSRLVTGSKDGVVRVWDYAIGKVLFQCTKHQGAVLAVAVSPRGDTILSGSADKTARFWDAETGEPRGEPLVHDGPVYAVAYSRAGDFVATGGTDRIARLWNGATGERLGPDFEHPEHVQAIALSRDGKTLLTGCGDEFARLWDVQTGKRSPIRIQHHGSIHSVAFSADDRRLLTGSADGTCCLWDVATGKPLGVPLAHQRPVVAARFHPSRSLVLTGSSDGTARLWDCTSASVSAVAWEHPGWVQAVAFSPDGKLAVTGCGDGIARIWEVASGKERFRLDAQDGSAQIAFFSAEGRYVVTGAEGGVACVWEAATGKRIHRCDGHQGGLLALAISPNSRYLVTAGADRTCLLWDLASGGAPTNLPLGDKDEMETLDVAFSPDNRFVLTGSKERTAVLWDATTGNRIQTFSHPDAVFSLAFAPDGKTLATGCGDGSAWLWDVTSGKPIGKPLVHFALVRTVAFSPDGTRVVTASFDHSARVWNAATGERVGAPMPHRARVRTASFSADNTRVVTASFDDTARVWDAATGRPIGPALPHDNWVVAAAFHPDGEVILTGSADKTARLWRMPHERDNEPTRIRLWVEVLTGSELGEDGSEIRLDTASWLQRRHLLEQAGDP
jgi:WD40 repeat protein/serine/threonine protein kinase